MKKINILLLALLMIAAFISIRAIKENNAADEAREWAAENGYAIMETTTHMTSIGTPFYYLGKGQLILEMDVADRAGASHKAWMRTGTLSNDFINQE